MKQQVKENWDSDSEEEPEEQPEPAKLPLPLPGFLRLPRELRLEIYKRTCLPVRTKHRYLNYDPSHRWGRKALTIVHTYPSNGALLATCKQIHWELTALLFLRDASLERNSIRVIGNASCLDALVFKALLHCAAKNMGDCDCPRALTESFTGALPQSIISHAELHGLLDNVGCVEGGKKVVELVVEDPGPGPWPNPAMDYWTGLAHDVPRFNNWARSKGRELKIHLEVVIRPYVRSIIGLSQWRVERPLASLGKERKNEAKIPGNERPSWMSLEQWKVERPLASLKRRAMVAEERRTGSEDDREITVSDVRSFSSIREWAEAQKLASLRKAKKDARKITGSEGREVEEEEWAARWQDLDRSRRRFKLDLRKG
ncbi:hypothetical protein BU23DRAFT_569587 [Bimuria novae-zelandiae CBS 107.79]|uniref:Uncharacterized protein n=1 Tax=Bimuria novae-zelandiae CBS 107.79 TaxID=1447943 RepID=A0A6A5V543_9PLEO|nr:hypothetical protein BU23DRAFT_569587 [Bimuria novae-zelandiae CBS 107.79]